VQTTYKNHQPRISRSLELHENTLLLVIKQWIRKRKLYVREVFQIGGVAPLSFVYEINTKERSLKEVNCAVKSKIYKQIGSLGQISHHYGGFSAF